MGRPSTSLHLLLPVVLALPIGLACETVEPLEPLDLPDEHCQPLLAGSDCLLPYPSDFFRTEDAAAPGGARVRHQGSAKPLTDEEYSADVNDFRETDGFSRFTPILALLGEPVADEGFVHIFDDRAATTQPDSQTILLDTVTGALVPHFTDVDPRATDPDRQAIIIRPEQALEEKRRYVVAIQGVNNPSGDLAAAPEGFRRLLDARGAEDPALSSLQSHYDGKIFAPLVEAGLSRDALQLAWDFTTGADEVAMDDMLRARELALAALATTPPVVSNVVFLETEPDPVWRVVFGTVTAPLVMEANLTGAAIARDEEGRVRLNGETTFDFTAIIPNSVRDSFAPGKALHFGHGFFGGQEELDNLGTEYMVHGSDTVAFAIDWVGMSGADIGRIVTTVGGEVDRSPEVFERVVQAMVNWLALTEAIKGPLKSEAAFLRPVDPGAPGLVEDPDSPGTNNAGNVIYDDSETAFLGISMGHILGGVYTALNPAIRRSVLHVGGAGFSQMMFRALPFQRFLFIMDYSLPDMLDQQKLVVMLQRHLDRIEPGLYAPYVLDQELPIGPSSEPAGRQVLVQAGVADSQVPNHASYLHARLLNIPLVTPSTESVWGVDEVSAPHEGSGLTTFDLGVDDGYYSLAMPRDEETIVHDELRLHPEPVAQLKAFVQDGKIVDVCGGPCVLAPMSAAALAPFEE